MQQVTGEKIQILELCLGWKKDYIVKKLLYRQPDPDNKISCSTVSFHILLVFTMTSWFSPISSRAWLRLYFCTKLMCPVSHFLVVCVLTTSKCCYEMVMRKLKMWEDSVEDMRHVRNPHLFLYKNHSTVTFQMLKVCNLHLSNKQQNWSMKRGLLSAVN